MTNLAQTINVVVKTAVLFAALFFTTTTPDAHADAEKSKPLVVLIFDDSGAGVLNADELRDQKKRVLWNLRKTPRHLRNAEFKIISVHAPRVLFSGTSRSIRRRAEELVSLLGYESTACADLVGAFRLARDLIAEVRPKNAAVISVGSLVHTGSPCSGEISLPQSVPTDLPLKAFAQKEIKVLLLGVHHLQRQAYSLAFRHAGLRNGKVLGIAESKALLQNRGGLSDAM